MSTYDVAHLSLAEAILRRPRMYTATGSLAEILALFEGFDTAVRMAARCTDESPRDALEWITAECGIERHGSSPKEQVERIVTNYGSEDDALNALLAFAEERRQQAEGQKGAQQQ